MKRTLFALALVSFGGSMALTQPAFAQQPGDLTPMVTLSAPVAAEQDSQSLTPTSVTQEMWFYSEQMRRYDDPAQAVRRKAEYKAAQRLSRLNAMKWYGFSNTRPQAGATPMMGIYSPAWIGNGYDRYDWSGASWPLTAVRVDSVTVER
jgi:hypothetical protein